MEFKKYNKIYRIGHDETKELLQDKKAIIHVEEKVDGGNFRFYINEECQIIIGSRTQQLTSNEGQDDNMNKMFLACANFVRDKLKDKDLTDCKGFIFYGENCVKHTINYDWEKIPRYLGFDIYNIELDEFVDVRTRNEMFEELELDVVPYICELNIQHNKDLNEQLEKLVPISKYALESAPDMRAEGIVLKDYDRQLFAKYVTDKFKEKNAEAFGGTPKYNKIDDTNNAEFIFKYCTNNRIEKMIFKLIDEGFKLEMQMMKELPKRIYIDIFEEEHQEIYQSRWKLDFNMIRKLIPKRCKAVLEQIITNNAIQEMGGIDGDK